jgi:uncharacterized membrane protein YeaQ/YmgE (transglycosylase-associated protein family)
MPHITVPNIPIPDYLWKFIVGAVVALFFRYLLPGRSPGGLMVALLIGLAGAFAAAFLGEYYKWYHEGDLYGIAGCVAGAGVLLGIYRAVTGTAAKTGAHQNYDL